MNEAAIYTALGKHLLDFTYRSDYHVYAAGQGLSVVWENRKLDPLRPYLAAEIVRTGRTDDTLDGLATIYTGYLQVTVVSDLDQFSTLGLALADALTDHFAYPMHMPTDDDEGVITIMKPPIVQQGYKDGPDWRTPVRIDYEAS